MNNVDNDFCLTKTLCSYVGGVGGAEVESWEWNEATVKMLPTADSAQPGEAAWVLTLLEYFGAKWDIDLLVNVRMRLWQEIGKFKNMLLC